MAAGGKNCASLKEYDWKTKCKLSALYWISADNLYNSDTLPENVCSKCINLKVFTDFVIVCDFILCCKK